MPVQGSPLSAASFPLTLAEVKAYLRVDGTDQDDTITALLSFACAFVERETQQQMLTATKQLYLDRFPGHVARVDSFGLDVAPHRYEDNTIRLPFPPLQIVTSVNYLSNGSYVAVDPSLYAVDAAHKPGRIVLKGVNRWPQPDCVANAVRVDYVAGYGDTAEAVPELFKQAIRWLVGHCYENREAAMPGGVADLPFGLRAVLESLMFRNAYAA